MTIARDAARLDDFLAALKPIYEQAILGAGRRAFTSVREFAALLPMMARLRAAEPAVINPLRMTAWTARGGQEVALAINEVSLLRSGPQAAKLRVWWTAPCGWRSWSATAP